jgi:hypothetical protein
MSISKHPVNPWRGSPDGYLGECINAVVGVFVTGSHTLEREYVYQ